MASFVFPIRIRKCSLLTRSISRRNSSVFLFLSVAFSMVFKTVVEDNQYNGSKMVRRDGTYPEVCLVRIVQSLQH